jgi:hypothetical protein
MGLDLRDASAGGEAAAILPPCTQFPIGAVLCALTKSLSNYDILALIFCR